MKFKNVNIVLACLLGTLISFAYSPTVGAANLSDFQAGRIIDDQVFFDPNGLSVNEIQSFLNSKVSTCDTNGTQPYAGTTRAAYAASRGYPAPFTCLKSYTEQTTSKPSDSLCSGYSSSTKTAAEIIYGVAQSCGVNPRVLLVLLQKEQGLITDDWPWTLQYRGATGYGCPDTADCDSQYYGFFNQVYHAARQYKLYARDANAYSYRAYRNNFVQWSPNASCGGSTLYIQNQATAGLYNYTPYQPNQAALNAGYGNGDNCSAYGNRNFWLYYTDWFGSTTAPSYRWQPAGQSSYTNESKSTQISLTDIAPDTTKIYLTVRVKNTGSSTWYKNQINLATNAPQNRISALYDQSWLSPNRPATLSEQSVVPGEFGTFSFWATKPKNGISREYFTLVAENITWMNDEGLYFEFNVKPPSYTWTSLGQQAFTDDTKQTALDYSNIVAGDQAYVSINVKNTGNVTWYKNQINFATAGPQNRQSSLYTSGWSSPNRPATLKQDSVTPGATGTFEFWITFPKSGYYKEYFMLVAENITWMNDIGFYYDFTVKSPVYAWQPYAQAAYTDENKTTPANINNLSKGQSVYLEIKAKNIGNTVWRKNTLNLATNGPQNRLSTYYDSRWYSLNRPATLKEITVRPNEVGTFGFWVKAPQTVGTQREYFNFVAEYVTWLNDLGLYYELTTR